METVDLRQVKDAAATIREMTDGRGADCVVEAVGMEAHGGPMNKVAELAVTATGLLPARPARKATVTVGIPDGGAARRPFSARAGGMVAVSGVYGGAADPMPLRAAGR